MCPILLGRNLNIPCCNLQENLKHTLPSDSFDLIPDTSLDLRVGYEAQQIDWLCFQRILQASLPEYLEDRPATLSSLLVCLSPCCFVVISLDCLHLLGRFHKVPA